jgi:hypothetical protein
MLTETVKHLAQVHGIERLGMLTLTFADHVTDRKEAQRRWHSVRTHIFAERYVDYVRVFERQVSGRIHYHLVVVLRADIRSGANFEEFGKRIYKSANIALRSEWAFWRRTAPKYGFGRTELLPVKSSAEAIGRYVGKYVSKHVGQRQEQDRGARLVSYSRAASIGTTNFAWNSPRSWLWRAKLARWALRHECEDMRAVAVKFGPRWAYHFRDIILAQRLDFYPTSEHAHADGVSCPSDSINIRITRGTADTSTPCDSSQVKRGAPPQLRPHGEWPPEAPLPAREAETLRKYQLTKMRVEPTQKRLVL